MDLMRLLLRLSQLARNRPSRHLVYAAIGVTIVVLIVFGIEWLGLWPESLTVGPRVRPPVL